MSQTTSPSLLLNIRNAADSESWNLFVDLYSPIVRSYCFQRRVQLTDIDDIVQEVMTRVSTAIRSFDYDPNRGKFRAWLGTISANQIKSYLDRRAKRVAQAEEYMNSGDEPYVDPDTDWVNIFSERVLSTACLRIRTEFEETTWKSFEGTWLKNQKAADIALSLSIPIQNVYVNKSRVLRRLEEEIKMLAHDAPIQ